MSDEFSVELKQDVKEIKGFVLDLVKQGAVHNQILQEHEKRSTQLETRLTPIESDYAFRHRLFSITISIAGIAGSVLAVIRTLF